MYHVQLSDELGPERTISFTSTTSYQQVFTTPVGEIVLFTRVGNYEWHVTFDPVVQKMHDVNGLWAELSEGEPLNWVEDDAIAFLQQFGGKHDFILCGSGVSHFDRRFLKSWMPRFEKWFRYYAIDVGVLRRSLELIGRSDALLPKQDKAHRALADARYHLEEMRHIKKVLGVGS
jgi:oligoribonuclease (3'-5' exoribonuclease)